MQKVLVLDFGSQYTQLITRRIRELKVYAEIHPYNLPLSDIQKYDPFAIILSGGPKSVHQKNAPHRDIAQLNQIAPLLGICYGMQLMGYFLEGAVCRSDQGEYGRQKIFWKTSRPSSQNPLPVDLFSQFPQTSYVWMSHGHNVVKLPKNFVTLAESQQGVIAAISDGRSLGLQFHPEVTHTDHGQKYLEYFLFKMAKLSKQWVPKSILKQSICYIENHVKPNEKVLCALSGGVDSTITATLLTRTLEHEQVQCVFVDNGLLRKNEYKEVLTIYKNLGLKVHGLDAGDVFLSALKGVRSPETKRKIIGKTFIDVFDKFKAQNQDLKWLAQGTLYPDVIESCSSQFSNQKTVIKTHHNVGGLPKNMNLKVLEPLRELFKDEVRQMGEHLQIPNEILWRHPFPGPGLAVRILGEVTPEKVAILQNADDLFIESLKEEGLYPQIWQAFCVLLPVQTVGVQGDSRSYSYCLALRAVHSMDGMTADWFEFDHQTLKRISTKITNHVKEINRVVYDITSKPPGTIEWE